MSVSVYAHTFSMRLLFVRMLKGIHVFNRLALAPLGQIMCQTDSVSDSRAENATTRKYTAVPVLPVSKNSDLPRVSVFKYSIGTCEE